MNYKRITWNKIEKCIEKTGNEIKDRGIKPDCIISIFKGGMIPSRLMSDFFNIQDIYPIFAKYYDGTRKLNSVKVLPFTYNVEKKNILLCDDIFDTGGTINEVLKVLEARKPNRISTCTMIYKNKSSSKPSFYGEEVNFDDWVIFPWEKNVSKDLKEE